MTNIKSKFIAAFLLGLFVFANTPKRFLHDALTHHKHTFHNHSKCNPNEVHLANAGYNCHADNLVVETAYGISITACFHFTTKLYHSYHNEFNCSFVGINSERLYLRGPPIC